ncbi:hypothetical protein NMA58_04370 [Rhizobium sp. YTUHZ045]|uniref:hypothetical protein n=1 Tax=Rhizobium sp. YTUHZ045 TaxID=2962888 RepID=UPI003DA92906
MAFIGVFLAAIRGSSSSHAAAGRSNIHSIIFADAPIAEARVAAHEYCGPAVWSGIFLASAFPTWICP